MQPSHLSLYLGPETDPANMEIVDNSKSPKRVTIPLSEILPLLGDAVRSGRTWLDDFADDEITVSTDLYEVVLAYRHFRRPSA